MKNTWEFYGRAEPLAELRRIVSAGRWFFCRIEGRRRIGKTALLGRLAQQDPALASRLIYMQVPDSDITEDYPHLSSSALAYAQLQSRLGKAPGRPRKRSVNNDSILFVKNMQTLKTGGKTASVTVSTALLNQRLAISNAPRMLTPSEIKLLRQSKSEIADYVQKVYPQLR